MNIAIITGFDKPTVPQSKGGIEVWTSQFALEAAKRGHTIDLYASTGSINHRNINVIPIVDKVLPYYYNSPYFTAKPEEFVKRKEQFISTVFAKTLLKVKQKEQEYDVIIDSCSYPAFTYNCGYLTKPVISIFHFPVSFSSEFYLETFALPDNLSFIFPSQFQYKQAGYLPESSKFLIPHGIDISLFNFNKTGTDSMVWMSRIHKRMDKGVIEAMNIAAVMHRPLNIHTYIEPSSQQYYEQEVVKNISGYVTLKQYAVDDPIDKNKILGEAKLLLLPLQWDEPFGLVFLEAMACGTPIIAFARGAVPEIVIDGETGYLVNSSEDYIQGNYLTKKTGVLGLKEAVERLYALPKQEYLAMRKACRKHVEDKFTISTMVNRYDEVFQTIVKIKR